MKCAKIPARSGKAASFRCCPFAGSRGEDRLGAALFVHRRDEAVPGSGENPGRVEHLLQHRVELEALVDANTGIAQPRQALLELLYPSVSLVWSVQVVVSSNRPDSWGKERRQRGLWVSLSPPGSPKLQTITKNRQQGDPTEIFGGARIPPFESCWPMEV